MQDVAVCPRLFACALVLLVSACGMPHGITTAPTAPSASATPTSKPAAGYRLYVEDRYRDRSPWRLSIVDSGSGQLERQLPLGVADQRWSRIYAVEQGSGQPALRVVDIASGTVLREIETDRPYLLSLFAAGQPLSPNGRWLTLQAEDQGSMKRKFLVFDTQSFASRSIELPMLMQLFAISNDGARVYLTEWMRQPDQTFRNRLRVYDFPAARVDPQVVLDRSKAQQGMAGSFRSQIVSPDGRWLFSLYLSGNEISFIHALDLGDGHSFSVDLPWAIEARGEEQLHWQLALTQDANTLYAVNGALGMVAKVDLSQRRVLESATLDVPSRRSGLRLFLDAEAKGNLVGGAALSPDGLILFAPGVRGLLAIDTGSLSLRGVTLNMWTFDSLAFSPDGSWLYAVSFDRGAVLQVHPSTGTIAAEIPTFGWIPVGLLRLESKR